MCLQRCKPGDGYISPLKYHSDDKHECFTQTLSLTPGQHFVCCI